MAKIKKGLSLNGNSTGGKKKGFYFPEKDLELIEFLENQPESASKIIVRLVREYKNSLENQPQQTSNDQIMNIVNSNQEQLLQELGRDPKPEEIAKEMDMSEEKVREMDAIGYHWKNAQWRNEDGSVAEW